VYSRIPSRLKPGNEQGYILLMMMLFITVLAIAATAVAPSIAFQVRRDREEELIHRGVQYSRAIRRYVKKFGRYPMRIEELENTNNMRFLRKRYKDPVTAQDFKPLHLGEVQTAFGAGIVGATPVSAINAVPGVPTLGGAAQGLSTQPQQPQPSPAGGITNTTAGSTNASDQNQNAGQNPPGDESNAQSDSGAQAQANPGKGNTTPQTFGGGPIVGVVSTSKKETIRVFNKKNHYDQWQFIYDPNSDRGGLLNTPAQPPLQGVAPQVGQTGQPGQPTGAAPGIQMGISPQNPTVQPIQPQQPQQQPPPEQ
jgi:type II secretory pathway pseudopilin PulG